MNYFAYRAFNRFDAFLFYFVGFMCAAESYWWMLLVIPCAVASAVLEIYTREDKSP